MTSFTPLASLAGGALIGLAAVLLMALHGRIMGATGVLTGALLPTGPGDRGWRIAVLAGMISAPIVWRLVSGGMPTIEVPVSTATFMAAAFATVFVVRHVIGA